MPGGRTKPRVNSDEPLVANASVRGCTPVPQKIEVNPPTTMIAHVPGMVTRASGAYSAMMRSRVSNDLRGPANRLNTLRMATKWALVKMVITARGTTTVLTAEPSVQTTNATPATTANT